MRRLKVMAVIVGLIMSGAGLNELSLAINHGKQVTMTMTEFLSKRPEGRWLKLTDCQVAYQDLVYIEKVHKSYTKPEEVSVPVFATYQPGGTTRVILVVDSSRSKEVVKDRSAKGVRRETIEGFVRSGTFNPKLQKLARWKPTPDCVIIDEGRKPNLGIAVGMLGFGLAVLGAFAVFVMRPAGI